MKIIHLVTYDTGGAAKAAIRLSEALNKYGQDSAVIVLINHNSGNKVYNYFNNGLYLMAWKSIRYVGKKLWKRKVKNPIVYSYNKIGLRLLKNKLVQSADIIHIHWINNGYVSMSEIEKLLKANKKVVWTLHDMWAFTGGCHYSDFCDKYKKCCINCKYLISPGKEAILQQKQKKEIFKYNNIKIVGCSKWISNCAEKSYAMKGNDIYTIPNCIDSELYTRTEPWKIDNIKKYYKIDLNKKCILLGAVDVNDPRKGGEYIQKIINKTVDLNVIFIVFGNSAITVADNSDIIYLGNINEENELSCIYSMADVFISLSKEENLANTVMESLSCGTLAVAFDIGGMSDLIVHGQNGYLARPYDIEDFCNGILQCLEGKIQYAYSRENKFSYKKAAESYLKIYEKLYEI